MKLIRFLFCLFTILGISQIGKADQQINLVGNQITVYKGPWQNLTPAGGIRHITIYNIPKSYQMALQITNFDASSASVTLNNLYCSIDPNARDFDTTANTGKFTNITFSSNGSNATSSILNLAGGGVSSSGITITTPTLPCTSVTLEFSSATQVGTNVEIVARFSEIIIGATSSSGGISNGSNNQVQGVTATGTNASGVLPLIDGSLLPAINSAFNLVGVENYSNATAFVVDTGTALFTYQFAPPAPNVSNEYAIAFFGGGDLNTPHAMLPPWICIEVSCNPQAAGVNAASLNLSSTVANNLLQYNTTRTNSGLTTATVVNFLLFTKTPTIRQHQTGSTLTPVFGSNTLAGSTIVIAVYCTTTPCISSGVTDTQGNIYTKVTGVTGRPGALSGGGLFTWVASSNGGANTVTATGTNAVATELLELSNVTPAALNQPNAPLLSSNGKFLNPGEIDPGGLITAQSGFSFTETRTISAASTVPVSLWDIRQHGTFLSSCGITLRVTAIAGTTPTLNIYLQDTIDNIAFNDRLSFTQITATGNWFASLGINAGANSAITTDGALAVTTRIDGSVGPFGRIKFVLGGTGPSTTFSYNVTCR